MSGPFPPQIHTPAEEPELEGAEHAARRPVVSWMEPGEATPTVTPSLGEEPLVTPLSYSC